VQICITEVYNYILLVKCQHLSAIDSGTGWMTLKTAAVQMLICNNKIILDWFVLWNDWMIWKVTRWSEKWLVDLFCDYFILWLVDQCNWPLTGVVSMAAVVTHPIAKRWIPPLSEVTGHESTATPGGQHNTQCLRWITMTTARTSLPTFVWALT